MRPLVFDASFGPSFANNWRTECLLRMKPGNHATPVRRPSRKVFPGRGLVGYGALPFARSQRTVKFDADHAGHSFGELRIVRHFALWTKQDELRVFQRWLRPVGPV
jgi:hypothetical protein